MKDLDQLYLYKTLYFLYLYYLQKRILKTIVDCL